MSQWRIVFMGTPDFALPTLRGLLTGPNPVVGVFTQPDQPSGRGMRLTPPPVKVVATEHGVPVFQPVKLREPAAVAALRELQPDLVVVVAYGQILSREVLELPAQGCVNIHASLLPRWRGAAPITRALLEGDPETGITIIQMDPGLDTGPMLATAHLPITPETTGGQLHDQLAQLGAELLPTTIERMRAGQVTPVPQPEAGVTYAKKITKEDGLLDWSRPAPELLRRIRALHPWPAAHACLGEEETKLHAARPGTGDAPPGTVIALHETGPEVACGSGSMILTELQRPGKRRVSGGEWLRGVRIAVGEPWR